MNKQIDRQEGRQTDRGMNRLTKEKCSPSISIYFAGKETKPISVNCDKYKGVLRNVLLHFVGTTQKLHGIVFRVDPIYYMTLT